MSKDFSNLDNIRVASPCPASWEQMIGDDQVRFCHQCRKNVYNLSGMSRREAEALVQAREARQCVRFYRRADGTMLTNDCPRGLRAVYRKLLILNGVAWGFLAFVLAALPWFAAFKSGGRLHEPQITGKLLDKIKEWFGPKPAPIMGCPLPPPNPNRPGPGL